MTYEEYKKIFPSKELYRRIYRQYRKEGGPPFWLVFVISILYPINWYHGGLFRYIKNSLFPKRTDRENIASAVHSAILRQVNLRLYDHENRFEFLAISSGEFCDYIFPFNSGIIQIEEVFTENIKRALAKEFIECVRRGYPPARGYVTLHANGDNVIVQVDAPVYHKQKRKEQKEFEKRNLNWEKATVVTLDDFPPEGQSPKAPSD